jgi:predicted enzyme related to lactoylglutathione lyase
MMAAPPGVEVPPAWTVLSRVTDVDATVAAAEAAGGLVLEPAFDLPDPGIAILADPTGAAFGVVRHPERPGAWLSTTPGSVCWVELLTRDPDTAIDFYMRVFGWEATNEPTGSSATPSSGPATRAAPTPVGDGHFAVIADPQGATFQLMDHTP